MGRRREQSGEQVRTSGVHHPRVVRRLLASTLRHGERQGRGSRRPQSLVARVNEIACHHGTRRRRTLARSGAAWGARAMRRRHPPAVPHPSAAPRPIDRRGWRGRGIATRLRRRSDGFTERQTGDGVVATERVWSARRGTPYAHTCAESPRSGASNACASTMSCPATNSNRAAGAARQRKQMSTRHGIRNDGVAAMGARIVPAKVFMPLARARSTLEPFVAASYAAPTPPLCTNGSRLCVAQRAPRSRERAARRHQSTQPVVRRRLCCAVITHSATAMHSGAPIALRRARCA